MAKVSIYLSFMGDTEKAFQFYKSVFQTEFISPIMYNRDLSKFEGMPQISEEDGNKIMHVSLPILAGTILMGTDMLESMGHKLEPGNNMSINLEFDTVDEMNRVYNLLAEGGSECRQPSKMFWGAYWGVCKDKFDIRWMFSCEISQ
jgi:PhnB protein